MVKKGSKLYSVAHHKCPRCQEGDLFIDPNSYNVGRLFDMHERCPVCNQKYELEIGFWWGAMYIAYVFSSVSLLAMAGIFIFYLKYEVYKTLAAIFVVQVILSPYVFRVARAIWLNLFVHYDASKAKEVKTSELG